MHEKIFPLGGPVSEKDIVDREDFLNSLQMRLNGGQSVMLAGPRRIGKTSLALEVLRRLKKQGLYTAFVDLFRVSSKLRIAAYSRPTDTARLSAASLLPRHCQPPAVGVQV